MAIMLCGGMLHCVGTRCSGARYRLPRCARALSSGAGAGPSTSAAPARKPPRRVWPILAAGAATAAMAAWGYTAWERERGSVKPEVTRFGTLLLDHVHALPEQHDGKFSPNEAPTHRHLRISAAAPLDVPDEVRAPHPPMDPDSELKHRLSIYSYYVKEPSLQIERAYTPIGMLSRTEPTILDFVVKRYADGEMSRFLHRLRPGAQVAIRGPVPTWTLPAGKIPDEVVLIVGGTGVTTAHQLLTNVLDAPSLAQRTPPRFRVLYAAQTPDSLQLVPELLRLRDEHPDLVQLALWVEHIQQTSGTLNSVHTRSLPGTLRPVEETGSWGSWLRKSLGFAGSPRQWEFIPQSDAGAPPVAVTRGRIERDDVEHWVGRSGDTSRVLLVCGPDGFIEAVAGPKGRDQVSQGPLRGILAGLGYASEQVVKL